MLRHISVKFLFADRFFDLLCFCAHVNMNCVTCQRSKDDEQQDQHSEFLDNLTRQVFSLKELCRCALRRFLSTRLPISVSKQFGLPKDLDPYINMHDLRWRFDVNVNVHVHALYYAERTSFFSSAGLLVFLKLRQWWKSVACVCSHAQPWLTMDLHRFIHIESNTESGPGLFYDAQPQWLPDDKATPLLCTAYLGVCQSTFSWHHIWRRCPGDGTNPSSYCPTNPAGSLTHT